MSNIECFIDFEAMRLSIETLSSERAFLSNENKILHDKLELVIYNYCKLFSFLLLNLSFVCIGYFQTLKERKIVE
jgi:hypothetical protein